jgi:ribosomal protein S18 acetylase RimI-like enzyme
MVINPHPLDNPARSSLVGPHAGVAERRGNIVRYPPDVSPFAGIPDEPTGSDWRDLAALAGPGALVGAMGLRATCPDDWDYIPYGDGVQMVGVDAAGRPDEEAVVLGPGDVPEMLELAARTRPGPFLPRTVMLGTYLGIRRDGGLVAMAGERMRPPGWTEISAVCTDERWRGHGFAARLIRALVAGIKARGETPFLHSLASNTSALRVYEALGFRQRRTTTFASLRVPS